MHILTPILALLTTPTLLLAAPSTDLEHRSVAVVANFAPTSRFTRVPLNTRITLPVSSTTLTVKTLNNDFAVSAFRQAQNLKIDPAGPPPRDFKSDNGRWIDFDANSRFAVWAAAQNARKDKKFVSGTSGLNIV